MDENKPGLTPEQELEALTKDIEIIVARFSIRGQGVSGHIESGYMVRVDAPQPSE